MSTYKTYNELRFSQERAIKNETNDCTVVAAVLTCGVSYDEAHEAFRKAGRRNRHGTYEHQQRKALKTLGAEIVNESRPRKPNGGQFTCKTIGKELGNGKFYVFVARHALAVIDGEIQDWSANTNRRVKEVWEIKMPGDVTPVPAPVAKKVGAKVEVTNPNGFTQQFTSVLKAFQALDLDVKKHQKFRYELKRSANGTLTFQGFEFRCA